MSRMHAIILLLLGPVVIVACSKPDTDWAREITNGDPNRSKLR